MNHKTYSLKVFGFNTSSQFFLLFERKQELPEDVSQNGLINSHCDKLNYTEKIKTQRRS